MNATRPIMLSLLAVAFGLIQGLPAVGTTAPADPDPVADAPAAGGVSGWCPEQAEPTPSPTIAGAPTSASPSLTDPLGGPPSPPVGTPWRITLTGDPGACRLDDVVSWRGGFAGIRGASVVLSPDGITWEREAHLLPDAEDIVPLTPIVVAYRGSLLAFAARRGDLAVWRSSEGRRWRAVNVPSLGRAGGKVRIVDAVIVRGPRIVVLAGVLTPAHAIGCEVVGPCPDTSVVWSSGDGRRWIRSVVRDGSGAPLRRKRDRPEMLSRIWVGQDGLMALASDGRLVASSKGIRWRPAGQLPGSFSIVTHLGYRGRDGATYAVVYTEPTEAEMNSEVDIPQFGVVLRSTDLSAWTEAYRLPYPYWRPTAVVIAEDVVAMGGYGRGWSPWMATSSDGVTWDVSAGWPGFEHGCTDRLAVGHGQVVAIGGSCEEGPLAWVRPVSASPVPKWRAPASIAVRWASIPPLGRVGRGWSGSGGTVRARSAPRTPRAALPPPRGRHAPVRRARRTARA